MSFTQPFVLIGGVIIAGAMVALAAYFTRAPWRRIAFVLLASIPVVPFVMLLDATAASYGWWAYPSLAGSRAPIAWYVMAALVYGAGLGLIGRQVTRRFGKPGLAVFLLGVGSFGLARDLFYSNVTGLIQFGPGILPLALDFLAYMSMAALVQLLMRLFIGTPAEDLTKEHSQTKKG